MVRYGTVAREEKDKIISDNECELCQREEDARVSCRIGEREAS